MTKPIPSGDTTVAPGGPSSATVANQMAIAVAEAAAPGPGTSMQPAPDEPHSNLPFDPRMMRRQFWSGAKNVSSGVITNDSSSLGGNPPLPTYNLPVTPDPFYCFFLFNPAEIDANYGFDPSPDAMLPLSQITGPIGGAGGVLTQTVSFSLLFDRTYEVWNGPNQIPPSASYGFGQGAVVQPKHGGPYQFGVLWDVWALERLCGIFRQVDGIPPQGPPTVQLLHVMTGGVNVANTMAGADASHAGQSTAIDIQPTPSSLDFWGWMTQFSVQYTRFDTNMVPTRCAVSLGFQLTYAQSSATTAAVNDTLSAAASDPAVKAYLQAQAGGTG